MKVPALVLAFLALPPPAVVVMIMAQDAPVVAVTCEQETYALCAYANCTINADLKTANCPCYSLSGPSVARIDVIPDAAIQKATMEACSKDPSCTTTENDNVVVAPICQAIADKALWGADAVSTFSMALQEENGVAVDENGARDNSMPTWSCQGVEGRLVPNCMLAPCRKLETPVANPYFDGEASMECVCPLLEANVNYTNFGGLQSPCEDSLVPEEGGYVQNTGGPVFVQHAMDPAAVMAAWEAVRMEFNKGGDGSESNGNETESETGSDGSDSSSGATTPNLALTCVVAWAIASLL